MRPSSVFIAILLAACGGDPSGPDPILYPTRSQRQYVHGPSEAVSQSMDCEVNRVP
jgi:hypothetical protein